MNLQEKKLRQIWPNCDLSAFVVARTNSGAGEVSLGFRDIPHEFVSIFYDKSHVSSMMLYCCGHGTFVHPNSRICGKCHSPLDVPEVWPKGESADVSLLEHMLSNVLEPLSSALVANVISERLQFLDVLEEHVRVDYVPMWLEKLNKELVAIFRDRL